MASQALSNYETIGPTGGTYDLTNSWHGVLPLDSAETSTNFNFVEPSTAVDKRIGSNADFYDNASIGLETTTTIVQSGGGESEESSTAGPRWE